MKFYWPLGHEGMKTRTVFNHFELRGYYFSLVIAALLKLSLIICMELLTLCRQSII